MIFGQYVYSLNMYYCNSINTMYTLLRRLKFVYKQTPLRNHLMLTLSQWVQKFMNFASAIRSQVIVSLTADWLQVFRYLVLASGILTPRSDSSRNALRISHPWWGSEITNAINQWSYNNCFCHYELLYPFVVLLMGWTNSKYYILSSFH